MNLTDINEKPKIEYPTQWKYKIIFDAGDDEKAKVAQIMGDKEYSLSPSKSSKNDKYASFELSTVVDNEHERMQIFSALKNIAKYVL